MHGARILRAAGPPSSGSSFTNFPWGTGIRHSRGTSFSHAVPLSMGSVYGDVHRTQLQPHDLTFPILFSCLATFSVGFTLTRRTDHSDDDLSGFFPLPACTNCLSLPSYLRNVKGYWRDVLCYRPNDFYSSPTTQCFDARILFLRTILKRFSCILLRTILPTSVWELCLSPQRPLALHL
ncbi:hypothetical protein BC835DRAFT_618706 [Cytidiella melzeri]|nr:hypothetical protein BC835DRAFT_618706 [Cytidiella melzeri]